MTHPTPRDLDPKFRNATVPNDARTETETETVDNTSDETPAETLKRLQSSEIPKDPEEGFITHRTSYVDSDGVPREKVHGPMPVSEWPKYSQEHGF